MALDTKALSITSAYNSIKSFFESQENNSIWQDLTTSSEGIFLMKLLANVFSVISLNTVTGRRESFHDTANLLSSQIGLAVNNGYSVYRGRNQRRLITFIPNESITIPKFTPIGNYEGDYFIYTTDSVTFEKGVEIELQVVVGALKEISWTANTSALKKFVRFEQNISEDIALYMDSSNEELDWSKIKKDQCIDKYYVYTNPWKSVTIEYLNNALGASQRYDSDTVFRLKYIELDDVETKDFTEDMFTYGTITNTLVLENFVPFESIEEISINSPIYREVQNLVRSKADFADIVKQCTPNITQTSYKPLTPTYTAVTYMKDDHTHLEEAQYKTLMLNLEPCMKFGRPLPDIIPPEREVCTLDITLGLTNRYTDESVVTADVQNIIDNAYANKFNQTVNVYDIESLLNKLSYVKYSRVQFHIPERQPVTEYKVGDLAYKNQRNYKAVAVIGQSGINEPDWVIPNTSLSTEIYTGLETVDKDLIWACYKRLDITEDILEWKPNAKYAIGDYVYSQYIPAYMFKCVDIRRATDTNIPDVTTVEVGDYIQDGKLVLVCIPYSEFYPSRASGKYYRLGDKYTINGKSFEYVGLTGLSGSTEALIFNDTLYELYPLKVDEGYTVEEGYVYIDNKEAIDLIRKDDIIRLSIAQEIDTIYEEIPAEKLTMNSSIRAKVADYADKEDEAGKGDTIYNDTTINLGMLYSASTDFTEGYIASLPIGAEIEDGDLIVTKQEEYNPYHPDRQKTTIYTIGSYYNIRFTHGGDEDGEPAEVVGYTFQVTGQVSLAGSEGTDTGANGGKEEDKEEEKPVDENAHWKELEGQLRIQERIDKWIMTEGADGLRCPKDVLDFYDERGKLSEGEYAIIRDYYNHYDEADEQQIYMFMEQFKVTRLEAIKELNASHQLKAPIADYNCLKYYDEDDNLVYIDRYNVTSDKELGINCVIVNRYDKDNIFRVERRYNLNNNELYSTKVSTATDIVSEALLVTVTDVATRRYSVGGIIKELVRLGLSVPVKKYVSGTITISYAQTDDGEIRWTQVDNDLEMTFDWNVYTNFDINLDLKY